MMQSIPGNKRRWTETRYSRAFFHKEGAVSLFETSTSCTGASLGFGRVTGAVGLEDNPLPFLFTALTSKV